MAVTILRKRSPRAPTISLREAVDRAVKIYENEGKHPATVDIVAQHLGYKSSANGAAKQVLATLGYFGLVERPADGMLAVTKSVEGFKFAPSDIQRAEILRKWLVTPGVYAELLEKYQGHLPSEASLKYELIQKGFNPTTADECLAAFLDSVKYVEQVVASIASGSVALEAEVRKEEGEATTLAIDAMDSQNAVDRAANQQSELSGKAVVSAPTVVASDSVEYGGSDKIPVRLAGGRRAWLVIPSPLYKADKERLKSHIDLLLADDDEE
jgi:hypothetical protein